MATKVRCMGCFQPLQAGVNCGCGFDPAEEVQPYAFLPGTELHSQQLSRRYQIGKVLGTGSFAMTYAAWDLDSKRRVAIKEFFPRDLAYRQTTGPSVRQYRNKDSSAFTYGLARFLKEAEGLKNFDHPNIVEVIEYFQENDTAYLVMPYYPGINLEEYLDNQELRRMDPEAAVKAMHFVLDGLRQVHSTKLGSGRWMHRDVKPANILIREDMSPLLIDFGSARAEVVNRSKGPTVILTPGYAPPEQGFLSERSQGPWVDVYACAATLYECLAGHPPVPATERDDSVKHGEPDPIIPLEQLEPKLNKPVDADISKGIMLGLTLDYEKRPQDAKELQDALKGIYLQRSQPSPGDRQDLITANSASRRVKLGFALVALGILALGILSLRLGWELDHQRSLNATLTQEVDAAVQAKEILETQLAQVDSTKRNLLAQLLDAQSEATTALAEKQHRVKELEGALNEAQDHKEKAELEQANAEKRAAEFRRGREQAEQAAALSRKRVAALAIVAGKLLRVRSEVPGNLLKSLQLSLTPNRDSTDISSVRFQLNREVAGADNQIKAVQAGDSFGIYFWIGNTRTGRVLASERECCWKSTNSNQAFVIREERSTLKIDGPFPCSAEDIVGGNCILGAAITVGQNQGTRLELNLLSQID